MRIRRKRTWIATLAALTAIASLPATTHGAAPADTATTEPFADGPVRGGRSRLDGLQGVQERRRRRLEPHRLRSGDDRRRLLLVHGHATPSDDAHRDARRAQRHRPQVRPIRLLWPLEGREPDRGRGQGRARRARGGLSGPAGGAGRRARDLAREGAQRQRQDQGSHPGIQGGGGHRRAPSERWHERRPREPRLRARHTAGRLPVRPARTTSPSAEDLRYATPFGLKSPSSSACPRPRRSRAAPTRRPTTRSRRSEPSTARPAPPTRATTPTGGTSSPRSAGPASPASPRPAKSSKLWRAARMFALVNMVSLRQLCRGLGFQVPLGLLAALHRDPSRRHRRQPHTVKDAAWQSYLETPPVQDYPSTHSALGAGAAEVLKRVFGTDHVPFSMESMTALPANPVRSFNTFTQAANENADSRVRAGIHFRFATEQGKALGRKVGTYIVQHHLQPR